MPPAEQHLPRNSTITPELPLDIIFSKILPRLPTKHLLPCMRVSKQWHSFLKTPLFNKLHLHHLTKDHNHQNHHKFLIFSTKTQPTMLHTIDCEAPMKGSTPRRPLPFELATHETISVVASFGGLVCVGIFKFGFGFGLYSDMILWNPLTRDYKRLPKVESYEECYNRRGNVFGLYYTSSDDDYKLLCVTFTCDAYVYSLRSDAWKKIDSREHLKRAELAYDRWSPCILANEKLYFLNYISYDYADPSDPLTHSVISFDTKTEKFTAISTHIPRYRYVRILNHRGCVYLYVAYRTVISAGRSVELWSLMDQEWTKVVTYPLDTYARWASTHPVHLMNDGYWLTIGDGWVFTLELARRRKYGSWPYEGRRMKIHTRDKYIETLVSPNQYIS